MHEISKIFCLGLPRTATSSLAEALGRYDISTIHFPFSLYESGLDASVITDYTAFVDTPIPLLYQDMDKRWPNAKFILTVREKTSWLESMKWLRNEGGKIWQRRPVYDEYNKKFFGTAEFDETRLGQFYDDYHAEVHSYFSDRRDDLLTLDITSSSDTKELVRFLNLDADPILWPRSNQSREPSVLQEVAYQFERRHFMKAGSLIRRIAHGLRRRLGNGS